MAGEYSGGSRNSSAQLLEELEALSQTLYQQPLTSSNRRTASLALPRSSVPVITASADDVSSARAEERQVSRPWSRRMSLSPWRSRPKLEEEKDEKFTKLPSDLNKGTKKFEDREERKRIWNWKPIRALSHIGMQKLSCLFSVEVAAAQNLPASMNGLRLGVCVRKKETKDGAVHTMPSRVSQGSADFEETLFIKCHVYYAQGNGKQTKFEPRPFWIYLSAFDAQELDFGRHLVDLSQLIQESMEKSYEGARVRHWDRCFDLSGKAKGAELVLKLAFQIMEKDGGIGIYNNPGDPGLKSTKPRNALASFARKQSKTSFSVPSPKMTSRCQTWAPAGPTGTASDFQGIEHLNLDEPDEPVQKKEEPVRKMEDDFLDFEVVDKGVEIQDNEENLEGDQSDGTVGERSVSNEAIIKEMVNDPVQVARLTELDSIALQIKALESMMNEKKGSKIDREETELQRLDEEEETVTREFLELLEDEETEQLKFYQHKTEISQLQLGGADESISDAESRSYLPDLGKGIGCVVQTRDGGYLVSTNPFDTEVSKKDTPKLVMQISKPMVLILPSGKSLKGFELFHKMTALGLEELSSRIISLMPLDELMGKTIEQIAFEGIAAAIIQGRNKERANTSAARTVASVKTMVNALSSGRKERILTGIWNLEENPSTADEVLAISLQKIEDMAIEALKIQAGTTEEDPPFDVSALNTVENSENPLASVIHLEEWLKNPGDSQDHSSDKSALTLAVTIQLRDPIRRYEAVGGPILAMIHAARAEVTDNEKRFKVTGLHVGGLKAAGKVGKRSVWDAERQRLTAAQWLVAYGLGKAGKKAKQGAEKGQEIMWSISSRVMADMWLKSIRNPDVRFSR